MSTDTPRTDTARISAWGEGGIEGSLGFSAIPVDFARELERENARLREELELIRAALTGDDYASLPSDLPTVRMAHTVRADHDKFRNQVRDTCHRAEQAEKELAEAKRERDEAVTKMQQGWLEVTESGINHYKQVAEQSEARALAAEKDTQQMAQRKDDAYLERNQVVSALSKCFPSGVARTAIDGWSEDWHGCVYIDLPTGQVSWHFHDSQAYLFAHLPAYQGSWDGHDTPEKYRRLAAIAGSQA